MAGRDNESKKNASMEIKVVSSDSHEPPRRDYTELATQLIATAKEARRNKLQSLAGAFLGELQKTGEPEAINKFFCRFDSTLLNKDGTVNPDKSILLTASEIQILNKVIGAANPIPAGKMRDRRVFLAALTGGGIALLGLSAGTAKNKMDAALNEGHDQTSWTHAFKKASTAPLGWGSSVSNMWAIKKALDAYFIKTSGLTAFQMAQSYAPNESRKEVLISLTAQLDSFLINAAQNVQSSSPSK